MVASRKKAGSGQAASMLTIPIALLVLCVTISIAFVAFRSATQQQAFELDREQRQIAQSLGYEAESLLIGLQRDDLLGDILAARDPETLSRQLASFNRAHGLDHSALIDKTRGEIIAEQGDPDLLSLRSQTLRRFIEHSRLRGIGTTTIGIGREARVVQDGQTIVLMASLPFGRNLVLVASKPLGTASLRRLSTIIAIPNLSLVLGRSTLDTSHAIPSLDGETRMSLIWEPSRKASEILIDLALFGLAASIMVAAVGVALFRMIRNSTAAILQREAKASHDARHDALSGLPNRSVFVEALTEEIEHGDALGARSAILLLDLDKFKDVNDSFGHAAGDRVIVEFGHRVRALLRQTDVMARLGGDEFAVLQTGITSTNEVTRLAQAIIDVANRPFMMDNIAMRIGVTVGISITPDDGEDVATVLRAADTALYRAKNEGRNRFSLYEHRMTEQERMRKRVDDELRGAIERDELTLVYQPQVHADSGKIAGVEALVRWNHPTEGTISPAMFIAAAEERGLIVPLGDWVMRRACRDAARWPGMRVGVNVSAIQFRQQSFVGSVQKMMREFNIEPGRLELELTEGVLVEDADQAEAAMMQLRAIGVKLALDDFGTGYSSLIYLRRFAFDKIKIDKSFLDSMEATGESAILVHSVVHLGRALGLEVTAEGVETEDQRRFLQAVGCHYLQGYLFSRPVPAEAIDRLLAADCDLTQIKPSPRAA
jgi:diguanylate cyclase (GGDEF)-like protein